MTVYLLHIDPPLRHSRHYIGYANDKNLEERIRRHQKGTGGTLPRYAVKQGSTITVAYIWKDAPREFERYVKRHGGAGRYCPICGLNKRVIPSLATCQGLQPAPDAPAVRPGVLGSGTTPCRKPSGGC